MIPWVCLLLACFGPEADPNPPDPEVALDAPEPKDTPRMVILISIDTLRADFLGCYDHPWVKTPFIDELAAEGTLFRRHVSVAPTTLNSHMSIMTGTYPHRHGVPRNGYVADPANRMLPELLSQGGWSTAAFIGGYPLVDKFGFNQGFGHFDDDLSESSSDLSLNTSQRTGAEVNLALFEWLDTSPGDRPIFIFVHYFDVHAPYVVPEPYHSMYLENNNVFIEGSMADLGSLQRKFRRGDQRAWRLSKALMRRYAGGVSYADAMVGELLGGLEARDYLDEALIVLTSDHGETMDEHPQHEAWTHGYSVFDTAVHTPLIVRMPGLAVGARVQEPVSSIDIAPTILDLVGLAPPARMHGTSLAASLRGEAPYPPDRTVFSEATKPRLAQPIPATDDPDAPRPWANAELARSARTANYKAIQIPHKGRMELYDLQRDPGEQHDLMITNAGAVANVVRLLSNRLIRWSAKANPLPAEYFDTDPEATALLEALGYVEDEEAPVAPENFVFQPGMDELVEELPQ